VGLPPERIRVIYNGVDDARLTPSAGRAELRRRLGWPEDAPVVLAVGRLVPEKNYPMMFRAVRRLRERCPGLRTAIAGWGRQEEKLRELRTALGLEDCVELLGRREDVADLMAAADVFAMSSNSEGFSNALLEAMWVGLPVVSTRVNGAVEIVRDGENGFLVDVGDEAALSGAIGRLLSDGGLRQRLGEMASRDVRARFSVSAMVAAHVEAYEEAAGRRRAAGISGSAAG
jgi:glycosyltransferase involved in cell wall biosynthesis